MIRSAAAFATALVSDALKRLLRHTNLGEHELDDKWTRQLCGLGNWIAQREREVAHNSRRHVRKSHLVPVQSRGGGCQVSPRRPEWGRREFLGAGEGEQEDNDFDGDQGRQADGRRSGAELIDPPGAGTAPASRSRACGRTVPMTRFGNLGDCLAAALAPERARAACCFAVRWARLQPARTKSSLARGGVRVRTACRRRECASWRFARTDPRHSPPELA